MTTKGLPFCPKSKGHDKIKLAGGGGGSLNMHIGYV